MDLFKIVYFGSLSHGDPYQMDLLTWASGQFAFNWKAFLFHKCFELKEIDSCYFQRWLWNPRADVTRSDIERPHKNDWCPPKIKENKKAFQYDAYCPLVDCKGVAILCHPGTCHPLPSWGRSRGAILGEGVPSLPSWGVLQRMAPLLRTAPLLRMAPRAKYTTLC